MNLDSTNMALITRLAQGHERGEPAVFSGQETEVLLQMIDAHILKESAFILWRTTPGATQNLAEAAFLGEAGLAHFLR